MDAANVIFHEAKRRVFIWDANKTAQRSEENGAAGYEDDEAALREAEDASSANVQSNGNKRASLPPEVEPVLEENPKWHLLREVLDEIEQEIHFTGPDQCKCQEPESVSSSSF